jgi:hypothetical protein
MFFCQGLIKRSLPVTVESESLVESGLFSASNKKVSSEWALRFRGSDFSVATCCVAYVVVDSFMSKVPTQYWQVTAAPVEAK